MEYLPLKKHPRFSYLFQALCPLSPPFVSLHHSLYLYEITGLTNTTPSSVARTVCMCDSECAPVCVRSHLSPA